MRVVEALYGGALAVPAAPRNDLLPLVTYAPPIAAAGTPAGPVADLLRLNTGVAPTRPAGQPPGPARRRHRRVPERPPRLRRRHRHHAARRRWVACWRRRSPASTPSINGRLGDGVNVNDEPYPPAFPYVGLAPNGRNRRHVDPASRAAARIG